jgi:anti-sigma regulatory factor (Ser/Thr protein kinase)
MSTGRDKLSHPRVVSVVHLRGHELPGVSADRTGGSCLASGYAIELGAFPSAVPCARGHVRTVVREWGLGASADTAELLASELTTNAIQASQRLGARADLAIVPVVRFWLLSDLVSLVIRVWDGNDQMPVRRDADLGQEGGRGLMLVESLAAERGASREANGKVVWALINLI